jgi:hypothetical protein
MIPKKSRLPANESILCAFAACHAGRLSGDTIRGQLTAIKAWHHINNAEWKGNTRLHLILKGAKNLTPLSSKRPLHPPISSIMLKSWSPTSI